MSTLKQEIRDRIDLWLSESYASEGQNELRDLLEKKDYNSLEDAFYKDLEFGTGGMRGIMGFGTNRINKFTLGKATQGFANYLKKKYSNSPVSIVIAHDNRNNSDYFAEIVANVFANNGIRVYYFEDLRPTPELSFAIRHLQCQGGIMLTASHNPKEYNGYKVYGEDGGQLTQPDDENVISEVRKIEDISSVNFEPNTDNIVKIGQEIDNAYLEAIVAKSLSPEAIRSQKDLTIVYSPIHGTGSTMMGKALEKFGFENVHFVEEQMVNDGDFPTVVYPNPEEEEAMTLALEKGREVDADLILATDPDSDRVGIAAKNPEGEFELLNGNQMASLLTYYLLTELNRQNSIPENAFIVNTIVTTNLIDTIAESYGVECYNTLTGFKHIGRLITENEGKKTFIGGGEESYGYLVGDLIRDKDGIISGCLIAEMTAVFKNRGKSLYEAMIEMYEKHGLYRECLVAMKREGIKGAEEIRETLRKLRENPPVEIAGSQVEILRDYLTSKENNLNTSESSELTLPESNVLQFVTESGDVVSVRPSGTEPKIKFYVSVNQDFDADKSYREQMQSLENRIDEIVEDLGI